jgi:branched-chain amino acid transport system substrate-binding protein
MSTAQAPIRIGVIQDWALKAQTTIDFHDALRLGFDEVLENGLLDRPVELLRRDAEAPPYGDVEGVVAAWRELVEREHVLCVIGPQVHHPCLALRDLVDAARNPMISHCITFDFPSEYCFAVPNGTFGDEMAVMAEWLVARGCRRIAVINDRAPIGDDYWLWFQRAARGKPLDVSVERVNEIGSVEEILPAMARLKASRPDILLYLGNGHLLPSVAAALQRLDWQPLRMTNLAMVGFHVFPQWSALFEGWLGLEQYDERNPEFERLLERFEARYGRRPVHTYAALGYDMARVTAEGISRAAKPLTGPSLKEGLEQVRRLPAALGSTGNVMSFARYDHRAYKGDYLLVRQVTQGASRIAD